MTPSATSHPAHADHDELLIAALAADDLTAAARSDAEDRLASCPDCAALHADLVAIAAATRALPAPARPRSFTLSPDQAARLRPPAWRRFTVGLRAPGGFARPLAATFTTLGVAGLLLTALPAAGPLALLGSSSGAAVQREDASPSDDYSALQSTDQPGARPAPTAPSLGDSKGPAASPAGPSDEGTTTSGSGVGLGAAAGATADPSPVAGAEGATDSNGDGRTSTATGSPPPEAPADPTIAATEADDAGRPWLLVFSLALLGLGLGLFAARRLGGSD